MQKNSAQEAHRDTAIELRKQCQESQGCRGEKATLRLKLETKRLWEQAFLPGTAGRFLPLLSSGQRPTVPSLPEGQHSRAELLQLPRLTSRADGGGEPGRSLLQGLNAKACLQVPAPGLEKPASLLLLSSPKEGPSLPGHTPTSPSSLHLPPHQTSASPHHKCSWFDTASSSSRQTPGEPEPCSFPAQEMLRIENKKA